MKKKNNKNKFASSFAGLQKRETTIFLYASIFINNKNLAIIDVGKPDGFGKSTFMKFKKTDNTYRSSDLPFIRPVLNPPFIQINNQPLNDKKKLTTNRRLLYQPQAALKVVCRLGTKLNQTVSPTETPPDEPHTRQLLFDIVKRFMLILAVSCYRCLLFAYNWE